MDPVPNVLRMLCRVVLLLLLCSHATMRMLCVHVYMLAHSSGGGVTERKQRAHAPHHVVRCAIILNIGKSDVTSCLLPLHVQLTLAVCAQRHRNLCLSNLLLWRCLLALLLFMGRCIGCIDGRASFLRVVHALACVPRVLDVQ